MIYVIRSAVGSQISVFAAALGGLKEVKINSWFVMVNRDLGLCRLVLGCSDQQVGSGKGSLLLDFGLGD